MNIDILSYCCLFAAYGLYTTNIWRRITSPPNKMAFGILLSVAFSWALITSTNASATQGQKIFYWINFGCQVLLVIVVWMKSEKRALTAVHWLSLTLAWLAITLWWLTSDSQTLIPMFLAILANFFGIVFFIVWAWRNPDKDYPLTWLFFSLSAAVYLNPREFQIERDILPLYYSMSSLLVFLPLANHRIKNLKFHLKDWIGGFGGFAPGPFLFGRKIIFNIY